MTLNHRHMPEDRGEAPLLEDSAESSRVDRVLRDFYRSEMPSPWPPLRLPETAPMPAAPGFWERSKSYLGLAASILFLIVGVAISSSVLRTEPAQKPTIDKRPLEPDAKLPPKPMEMPKERNHP